MTRLCRQLCIVGVSVTIMGCAQTESRQSSVMQAAPVNRPADNYEWVKRLQATRPIEGVQQVSATSANRAAFTIPVPANAGNRYALIVDPSTRLAWLQSADGMTGPWRLDQPDVAQLLKSVANLPTNPAANQ